MDQYKSLLHRVLREGHRQDNRTGVDAISKAGDFMSFDMEFGFPVPSLRKIAWKSSIGEMIAFMNGYTNAEDFRQLKCNFWNANANQNGIDQNGNEVPNKWLSNPYRNGTDDLGIIYGSQWTNWEYDLPEFVPQPIPNLRKDLKTTYLGVATGKGKEGHFLSKTWEGMISRCYDKNNISYPLYGGKGVSVCNEWLEFTQFATDAQLLENYDLKINSESFEYQLDKDIIGDGFIYSPQNCIWASAKENVNNTSRKRYTVEKDGVNYTFTNITDFCLENNIEPKNFSDLWTGNKNAKVRSGFSLISVETLPRKGKINQLYNVISDIMTNPTSRRMIVTAWRPDQFDKMSLPPCHVMFQFLVNVERQELSLNMFIRSNDLFLGAPANIVEYAFLLQVMAMATGYKAKTFNYFIGDAHIYVTHLDQVNTMLERDSLPLPSLSYTKPMPSITSPATALDWLCGLHPDDFEMNGYIYHEALTGVMAV